MPILVIAEHDNQLLKSSTQHVITAARALGDEVHVLVAGSNCRAVAEAAAQLAGVTAVKLADAPHYADALAENLAELVVSMHQPYSHIMAVASTSGKNFLPRVAAKLDVAQISDIEKVVSADTFVRSIYAGNALATVQTSDKTVVLTVRQTAFDPCGTQAAAAAIETVAAAADLGLAKLLGRSLTVLSRPDLGAAKVVVSGGRGLANGENFEKVLAPLADKLGAAIGASRAAVDAGYVGNDFQVGQTGKIVAPQLYIAVGISGAIQHLAGMKGSKVIVAINKDPEAPIFQVADYGLVADLFTAVPELVTQLG